MSFVKLSIFGTSFEVRHLLAQLFPPEPYQRSMQVTTRYVDLQPVGMGMLRLPDVYEWRIDLAIFRCLWSRLVSPLLCIGLRVVPVESGLSPSRVLP